MELKVYDRDRPPEDEIRVYLKLEASDGYGVEVYMYGASGKRLRRPFLGRFTCDKGKIAFYPSSCPDPEFVEVEPGGGLKILR